MRINFKRLFSFLLVIMVTMFALVAFGADPSGTPVGLPGTGTPSNMFMLILAAIPALAVAILDFLFAVNPSAKSNGILHWIYMALGGKETPPPK